MYFKLFAPPILDVAADRLSVTSLSPSHFRTGNLKPRWHYIIKTLKILWNCFKNTETTCTIKRCCWPIYPSTRRCTYIVHTSKCPQMHIYAISISQLESRLYCSTLHWLKQQKKGILRLVTMVSFLFHCKQAARGAWKAWNSSNPHPF